MLPSASQSCEDGICIDTHEALAQCPEIVRAQHVSAIIIPSAFPFVTKVLPVFLSFPALPKGLASLLSCPPQARDLEKDDTGSLEVPGLGLQSQGSVSSQASSPPPRNVARSFPPSPQESVSQLQPQSSLMAAPPSDHSPLHISHCSLFGEGEALEDQAAGLASGGQGPVLCDL